ncbi:hypothetical protein AJ79_09547 [Helicocarpus griseus UAMH5409]|uniref:Uncharacterized protein n=1 Tax=Helicocarpus griseus UAMH5409 TaxID=1447875 RepID=A0A2B7WJ15_9EURO|nr:hypothetical protein AJ79_09547 [Helicocarpus griseus UAMH5409]
MSSSVSTAQLKFLKNSAQYLAAQSPSTSSHLISVHNELLRHDSKRLSAANHREFCGACGSIRTPTSSKAINVKKHRVKKRRKDRRGASKQASSTELCPALIYKCLRCHRKKYQSFQTFTKNAQSRMPLPTAIASTTGTPSQPASVKEGQEQRTTATLPKSTENLSSKKRAKARKQQGLMVALAASKQRTQSQTSPPSSSLDLLDFLKH